MPIKSRLRRLESVIHRGQPERLSFEQFMEQAESLENWLESRGFADCLAAVEAGVKAPEGLRESLVEQAAYDPKRRAWKRIEAALDADVLPDDADVALHCGDGGRTN